MVITAQRFGVKSPSLDAMISSPRYSGSSVLFNQTFKDEIASTSELWKTLNSIIADPSKASCTLDVCRNLSGQSSDLTDAQKAQLTIFHIKSSSIYSTPKKMSILAPTKRGEMLPVDVQINIKSDRMAHDCRIYSVHKNHLLGVSKNVESDKSKEESEIYGSQIVPGTKGTLRSDRCRHANQIVSDLARNKSTSGCISKQGISSVVREKCYEEKQIKSPVDLGVHHKENLIAKVDRSDYLANSSRHEKSSKVERNIVQDHLLAKPHSQLVESRKVLDAAFYKDNGIRRRELKTSEVDEYPVPGFFNGTRGVPSVGRTIAKESEHCSLSCADHSNGPFILSTPNDSDDATFRSSSFQFSNAMLDLAKQKDRVLNSDKSIHSEKEALRASSCNKQINTDVSESINQTAYPAFSRNISVMEKGNSSPTADSLDRVSNKSEHKIKSLDGKNLIVAENYIEPSRSGETVSITLKSSVNSQLLEDPHQNRPSRKADFLSSETDARALHRSDDADQKKNQTNTTIGEPGTDGQTMPISNKSEAAVSRLTVIAPPHVDYQASQLSVPLPQNPPYGRTVDRLDYKFADNIPHSIDTSEQKMSGAVATLEASVQNSGQSEIKVHASLASNGVHASISSNSEIGRAMLHQKIDDLRDYLSDRGITVALNVSDAKFSKTVLEGSYSLAEDKEGSTNRQEEYSRSQEIFYTSPVCNKYEDSHLSGSCLDSDVQQYELQADSQSRLSVLA
jgi:hypothetical protein